MFASFVAHGVVVLGGRGGGNPVVGRHVKLHVVPTGTSLSAELGIIDPNVRVAYYVIGPGQAYAQ